MYHQGCAVWPAWLCQGASALMTGTISGGGSTSSRSRSPRPGVPASLTGSDCSDHHGWQSEIRCLVRFW